MTRKAVATLAEDHAPAVSSLSAFCPPCHRVTPMVDSVKTVKNGVATTSGTCAECHGNTWRVGAARAKDEADR